MRLFKKILLVVIILIFTGVTGLFVYLYTVFPKVQAVPDISIEQTPERLERGKYLFNSVMACIDCHSDRDFTKFSGPVVPGTEGKGGMKFSGEELPGFPGTVYAPNITPAALDQWTDGEIFRAITEGVSKDGRPLFPIMPYMEYRTMDKEDIYSVISYVRSLKPIENEVAERDLDFPLNFLVRTIPLPNDLQTKPDKSDIVKYGEYVMKGAVCNDCHTPMVDGKFDKEKMFSGGQEFHLPGNTILRSANLTPDNETGIGTWSKEFFISRFKSIDAEKIHKTNLKEGEFQTIMPWTMYSQMTEEDLGAIYEYLRTVKPVKNPVKKIEVAKK